MPSISRIAPGTFSYEEVVYRRAGGLDSSQVLQTVFMRHLQNPWIASTVSPKCDCHDVQSVDDFFCNQLVISFRVRRIRIRDSNRWRWRWHVKHDQLPFLTLWTPSQSLFPRWGAGGSSGRSSSSGCKCSRMPKADCQLSLTRKCFANVRHRDCE